jgi:uncharacterized membrane protein
MGSLHPVAVHFPIALVVTAAFAEFLHSRGRAGAGPIAGSEGTPNIVPAGVSSAARFMLAAAVPFALLSAVFGFAALAGRSFEPGLAGALGIHRVAGVAAAILTVLSAGLAQSAAGRGDRWRVVLYRIFLVLTAVAVAVSGHFGAVLTHGSDYPPFR